MMGIEETGLKIFLASDVVAFAALIGGFPAITCISTLFVGIGLLMFIIGLWTGY